MKKIKVLHLIKTLNLGGAELNLLNLVQAINAEQFQMHVGYSFGGEFETQFKESGIKLFKFAKGRHKIKSFSSFIIILRLIRYILKNKIDIVHTHTFNAHIWGSIAAKLTRRKIVEHVHDFRYLTPLEFNRRRGRSRQYKYVKYLKKISDKVIVLTKQNYEFLSNNKFYPENRIREVQNGIPLVNESSTKETLNKKLKQDLNIPQNNLIILTTCRIAPEKNIDLIFRIAPRVKKECPDAIFVVSGDGALLEEFKTKCKAQNLAGTIKIVGFYPRMYDLLSMADIFLLPSFLELHSIAMLEALSMSVPVVVSKNVGCNDEFIKSWDNGVLLDPFTNAGWPEAIIALIKDTKLRRDLGQKGYQLCKERFDIKDTVKEIENIYAEITDK